MSTQVTLKIDCSYCKHSFSKKTEWIDPSKFTNPKKASKSIVCYCPIYTCSKAMGFVISMNSDGTAAIASQIPYAEIFKPDRMVDYNLRTEGSEEENVEDKEDPYYSPRQFD